MSISVKPFKSLQDTICSFASCLHSCDMYLIESVKTGNSELIYTCTEEKLELYGRM